MSNVGLIMVFKKNSLHKNTLKPFIKLTKPVQIWVEYSLNAFKKG